MWYRGLEMQSRINRNSQKRLCALQHCKMMQRKIKEIKNDVENLCCLHFIFPDSNKFPHFHTFQFIHKCWNVSYIGVVLSIFCILQYWHCKSSTQFATSLQLILMDLICWVRNTISTFAILITVSVAGLIVVQLVENNLLGNIKICWSGEWRVWNHY